MPAFIENLKGLELLFACCALFGTVLFLIRVAMMFMGHGTDGDAGGQDGDFHLDGADSADAADAPDGTYHEMDAGDGSDSDLSFKLLSLQGLTAFFMMFGLVGWATLRQGEYRPQVPLAAGILAGLATVWVMKKIFQMASGLQSSGTLNLHNAVGREGVVYLTIHPGDTGKVQMAVQGRLMILEACSEDKEEIKTGQSVRVVKVAAGKLVVATL